MKSTFILPSPETGTDYHIYVHAPPLSLQGPWPAVYFMDGDDQFKAAIDAYAREQEAETIAPLLLVGVGYGASYSKPANRRGRDYTPTPHSDEPTSGHAREFFRFLRDTLSPELSRRYSIHDHIRGIGGHSLGSLLVLHALFVEEPFFSHYLASAPSIWWDDRSILKLAAKRFAESKTLPGHLFLSVGEEDTASMTGDLALLEKQLEEKPFEQLVITQTRFPALNHFNVLPDAFAAGLRALFPKT